MSRWCSPVLQGKLLRSSWHLFHTVSSQLNIPVNHKSSMYHMSMCWVPAWCCATEWIHLMCRCVHVYSSVNRLARNMTWKVILVSHILVCRILWRLCDVEWTTALPAPSHGYRLMSRRSSQPLKTSRWQWQADSAASQRHCSRWMRSYSSRAKTLITSSPQNYSKTCLLVTATVKPLSFVCPLCRDFHDINKKCEIKLNK